MPKPVRGTHRQQNKDETLAASQRELSWRWDRPEQQDKQSTWSDSCVLRSTVA